MKTERTKEKKEEKFKMFSKTLLNTQKNSRGINKKFLFFVSESKHFFVFVLDELNIKCMKLN